MTTQQTTPTAAEASTESTNILGRIAQDILIIYGWVSGPGLSEQQRIQQELAKAHRLELELDSTSIIG